tara:strand:- start:2403 stop:2678 length:276 start_codon:yes stop_codon:yes gene_type:complete
MSETKFELKEGRFTLHNQSAEELKENPAKPKMWGKLKIPQGAKSGDVLKLSAWANTSQAGNPYLNGRAELEERPSTEKKAEITSKDVDFTS